MPTKEQLSAFIEKMISYDASGGMDCPHCGKEVTPKDFWIDHKDSLAINITQFLGFGSAINDVVSVILTDYTNVRGSKSVDAQMLADIIFKELFS